MRRKSHYTNLILMLLAAVVLSSCGLGKMVKRYDEVKFTADPDVLESTGGKVPVTIKGEFPAKYFNKRAVMVYQPVVTYPGGTKELKPIVLKGEKVKGEGIVINNKMGGNFTYTDVFDFTNSMNASNLEANPVIFKAKSKYEAKAGMKASEALQMPKAIQLGNRKSADGVINTGSRILHDEDLLIADKPTVTRLIKGSDKDFYEKETIITKMGSIYFLVNQYDLNFSYKLNKDKAVKNELDSLKSFLKKEWKIKSIDLDAWASPEGEERHNQGLSENRAKTANKYMETFFKNYRQEKTRKLKRGQKLPPAEPVVYTPVAHGEDWDGFMKAVSASNIPDKNAILNVVRAQSDPILKEQEIRKMTVIYKEIEDNILPPLRRAVINVRAYLPKKTDEQIARLAISNPDSLDAKELLYAASLTSDVNTQYKIYKSLTQIYPADWKGFNNVAFIALSQGNLDEAKEFVDKANALSPNNPLILMNMGALAAKNGDYAGAKNYYKSAQDLGVDVNYNKGILMIPEGDYKTAASLISAKKCNYNGALVELLTGNASGAASTLECAPSSAQKFYLLAVVGARQKNQGMLFDNLRKAVKESPSLKSIAREDREFVKYFNTADFKEIVN